MFSCHGTLKNLLLRIFFLPEIAFLLFLSAYLTDRITLDQFNTKSAFNVKIDCWDKENPTQTIKSVMFCHSTSAGFWSNCLRLNARIHSEVGGLKSLLTELWIGHLGQQLKLLSPYPLVFAHLLPYTNQMGFRYKISAELSRFLLKVSLRRNLRSMLCFPGSLNTLGWISVGAEFP